MATSSPTRSYDVIVVGSGASGGWAAKLLTESGLHVAVVDYGKAQTNADYTDHQQTFDIPYRNIKYHEPASAAVKKTRPMQGQCYACTEWNYKWFANDLDEPFTSADNLPYHYFGRIRVLGGRTNVWGRLAFRLSDLDFKAASHDGWGEDWPISYKDLAPYYDRVEEYIGVSGMTEGSDILPDGHYQPPMGLSCSEWKLREVSKQRFGRLVTQGRTANLTKGINGRQPCHYCGPCERGCITHSYFNSSFTTLTDAIKTGKCDVIQEASAYQVLMDKGTNRAKGLLYVDRKTLQTREIYARVVVLAASALESTRILLNSKGSDDSNGLANSSGVLGHYYTDSLKGGIVEARVPEGISKLTINTPHRPTGVYAVRFRNVPGSPKMPNFMRGYGLQGSAGNAFNLNAPGFGQAYKDAAMAPYERFNLQCYGEPLPRFENHVAIDPHVVDKYGIPVLQMNVKWGDNERNLVKDGAEQAAEMAEAAGFKDIKMTANLHPPGDANHDVGTARMGNDPKKSVLNAFNQTHDVKNLFVMDGAAFNNPGCQNPTLTIMALAVRSTEYLKEQLRTGSV